MSEGERQPGSASLVVVAGAVLLRPDLQVFEAMLEGWSAQQVARRHRAATIQSSVGLVRRFQTHNGEFPWSWTPAHLDEWIADLVALRRVAHSTVRAYQGALRSFLGYVCDPAYGWAAVCEERFGTYPTQICGPWNMAVHRVEFEGRPQRRALSRVELQALFDAGDDWWKRCVRVVAKGGWRRSGT